MEEKLIPFIGDNPWAISACIIYFLLLVGIGFYAARFSSKGQENFLLGGRKMKSLVVGLSAVVSGRSAWLLLSVSGLAFIRGASAIWFVVGYTVVELVLFFTVAVKLRRSTGQKGDLTIPDYLASRFNNNSHLVRIVAASIIIIFLVTYVGAQIKAGGKALVAGFHLPEWQGVLITGAVILLYTAVGGFLAVSLTDVLQAFMMLFALIGLPLVALMNKGSIQDIVAALDPNLLDVNAIGLGALVGALGIGLGSPGNPHILVRFMSIENESKLKIAGVIGFIWNVLMGAGAVSIGLIGNAYFTLSQLPGSDREMIFPSLAGILPPFLFGLVISAIFAAIMSTADSQLLVATSAVVRDFFQKAFKQGRSIEEAKLVTLNRIVVVSLCVLSVLIGIYASEYVNFLVLLAWAGLGCSFGPVIILGLYWKKTSAWGALSGMLCGAAATFIWGLNPALKALVHEIVPAFFFAMLSTILVSVFTSEKTDDHIQE